ncbi:hypothetical protein INR49_020272 [Caranx melampygus]|nr:hypothetical protein INR49_020272 [Caranx melampygus]
MSPGEVTQWPQGPSGTSPLRNNSFLTSGNLPSLRHVGHTQIFVQTPVACQTAVPAIVAFHSNLFFFLAINYVSETDFGSFFRLCDNKITIPASSSGLWSQEGADHLVGGEPAVGQSGSDVSLHP